MSLHAQFLVRNNFYVIIDDHSEASPVSHLYCIQETVKFTHLWKCRTILGILTTG